MLWPVVTNLSRNKQSLELNTEARGREELLNDRKGNQWDERQDPTIEMVASYLRH
jgi:hypothetical protein